MATNLFIGIGNLGRDPETRSLSDGKAVTNFSIAISEKYKDKDGQQKEVTEWVNVAVFGRLAEVARDYLRKGTKVCVRGKLKTEKYEKDGIERSTTRVIADAFEILSARDANARNDAPASPTQQRKTTRSSISDMDDDVPFANPYRGKFSNAC
jgi:single-strand DNA-binding protein